MNRLAPFRCRYEVFSNDRWFDTHRRAAFADAKFCDSSVVTCLGGASRGRVDRREVLRDQQMQMAVLDQRNETVRASGISVAARHFAAGYRVDPAIVLATLQHDRCDELIDSHSRKHVASHFGPRLEGTMREGTGRRVESWFGPRAVLGALLLSAPA